MKFSDLTRQRQSLNTSALPSLNRIQSICREIQNRWPDIEFVPTEEHEKILRRMAKRIHDWDWEDTTVADVVRVAHVAFLVQYRTRPEFGHVRKFLINETKYSTRPTFLSAMVSIYAKTYRSGLPLTQVLSAELRNSRHHLKGRWDRILSEIPEVLEPKAAPEIIGTRMFQLDNPWNGLKNIGFADPHGEGLLSLAHLKFVEHMKPRLTTKSGVEKMLAWVKPPGHASLIHGAAEAIDALLDPWSKLHAHVPTDMRDLLTKGLVDAFGDPRVLGSNVAWQQIKRENKKALERWLTGTNIRFFLDVVTRVEDSHMWEPRREFWLGLYEEGRIDAAWVAFSPSAESVAEDVAKEHQNLSELSYGRQTRGSSRRKTSLLILKLGNCIIVEGSHNYKVQVFDGRDKDAPKLFDPSYDCDSIRFVCPGHAQITHHPSVWRESVLEEINYIS